VATTVTFYNSFLKESLDGTIDLDTDTLKVELVTSAYAFDRDAHSRRSSVTNEITGTGYTAGGVTLAGKVLTQDDPNDRALFDFTDPEWTSASFTTRAAVIYKSTGAAATDPLIAYLDFGGDQTVSGGTFRIALAALGFFEHKQV
jgi:hypothetical protein